MSLGQQQGKVSKSHLWVRTEMEHRGRLSGGGDKTGQGGTCPSCWWGLGDDRELPAFARHQQGPGSLLPALWTCWTGTACLTATPSSPGLCSSPTGRWVPTFATPRVVPQSVCGSRARVSCSFQWVLVAAKLSHAVTTVCNYQGWQGGHPAMPCWLVGAEGLGWSSSPGDGFPPEVFLSPMGRAGCRQSATKLFLFQTGQLEPLLSRFSKEEELQMKRVLQRMDVLAKVRGPWGRGSHRGGHVEQAAPMKTT